MPVGVKQFDLVSDWDARQSWDEGCNASGPEGPAAHNQGLATNYPPPSKGGHHLEKPRFFLNNSPSSSLQSYHRARMYTRIPTKIGMTKIGKFSEEDMKNRWKMARSCYVSVSPR